MEADIWKKQIYSFLNKFKCLKNALKHTNKDSKHMQLININAVYVQSCYCVYFAGLLNEFSPF